MEPVTIAAGVMTILLPLVKKGAEGFAGEAGKAVFEKTKNLLSLLKGKWGSDLYAKETLSRFEEEPEDFKPVVENLLKKKISEDKPVLLSKGITRVIENEAGALGYDYTFMDSGAGHDAQIMAHISKAGMIFIPSVHGKSHCPEEKSRWADIEKGTQLLLNSLIELSI